MEELAHHQAVLATFERLVDPSGTPIVKLIGELDISSIGPIRAALDAIVAGRPDRVVIDLSELRFIDSSGLSVFLSVAHKVPEVELRNPSAMVRKVIGLTGLSNVFVLTP
jgi:anti-anti-sigma factor